MITAGRAWCPSLAMSLRASSKVLAVEFVKSRERQTQFAGGLKSGEFLVAMTGQEMANERSGQPFDQL